LSCEKGKRERERIRKREIFGAHGICSLCNLMLLWLLHLCVCGCRPWCHWFVAGFWKPYLAGEVLPKITVVLIFFVVAYSCNIMLFSNYVLFILHLFLSIFVYTCADWFTVFDCR
jgi:hypothetical protein